MTKNLGHAKTKNSLQGENIDRIAEGIREFLSEFPDLKASEILSALKQVTKNYEMRLKKID